ncbi:hypothetical protein GobsT_45060 [Gemmata obscuriglobus]|uniref:Tetratricopeptide repeat protein n=2 Tax=Gemmata obscuriglobus TaxID=114 RepID=A0A2Z3H1A6_9BACT
MGGATLMALVFVGLVVACTVYSAGWCVWCLVRPFAVRYRLLTPTRDDVITRAWGAERAGQWDDALVAYEAVLRDRPGDEDAEARRAALVQRRPELLPQAEQAQRERLAGLDPLDVLDCVQPNHTDRKLLLFTVACCRCACCTPSDDLDTLLAETEARAEQPHASLGPVAESAIDAHDVHQFASSQAEARVALIMTSVFPWAGAHAALRLAQAVWSREECARLVECVFGLRGRTAALAPQWLTGTVVAIAADMYESRDFSAMPILADALQDAGCDRADILNHCRGPGPHVRGCWVVDLVLNKE